MRLALGKFLKRVRPGRGDTIVEVMLSMSILGVILATAYATSTRSLQSGLDSQYRNEALSYAQQQLELIKNADNSSAGAGSFKLATPFCINPANNQVVAVSSSTGTCPLPIGASSGTQNQYAIVDNYNSSTQSFTSTVQWPTSHNSTDQLLLYYKPHNSFVSTPSSFPPPTSPTVTNPPPVGLVFTGSPTSVGYLGSSTLSWTSNNAVKCTATQNGTGGWNGNKALSGSEGTGTLTSTTTYTLTCTGFDGSTVSKDVTITVAPPPTPSLTFTASPTTVNYNTAATLSWTSYNALSCNASGGWGGPKPLSGSQSTGNLTSPTTFNLRCDGYPGTNPAQSSQTVNTYAPPSLSFSAYPSNISYKDSTTLYWSASNATSCTASGAWGGNKPTSGSVGTGQLTGSVTYYLQCSGPGGSTGWQSAPVNVGPSGIYGWYYQGANFNYGGWGPYNDGNIAWCSVSGGCENGWLPTLRARTYLSEASCASVYWSGQVLADVPGYYYFGTYSDDGIRVLLNGGNWVIYNWSQHSWTWNSSGGVYLNPGWYSFQVWYQNNNGNGCWSGNDYSAAAIVQWATPWTGWQNIPQDHLRPY